MNPNHQRKPSNDGTNTSSNTGTSSPSLSNRSNNNNSNNNSSNNNNNNYNQNQQDRRRKMNEERKRLPIYAGKTALLSSLSSDGWIDIHMFLYSILARDKLIEEIKANDTVIIVGETGSGKTTRK